MALTLTVLVFACLLSFVSPDAQGDSHFLSYLSSLFEGIEVSMFTFLTLFAFFPFSGDALFALRMSLRALPNQLSDWNQNQVNPCTWSQVICDDKNLVTSL